MKKACLALLFSILFFAGSHAQSLAKYGNDFLSVGAGAKALGMGSAHSALTNDVTSAYWNVAGLAQLSESQLIYMHAERFGGIVGYDYGAFAMPLKSGKGNVGISFFRQGVDNIANTLNAWDKDRGDNGGPRADAEAYITRFSAADMAILISFATARSESFSYGVNAKFINHRLGPFANAWGYSLDVGAQWNYESYQLGLSIQDVTTMQKMWTVNEDEFAGFEESFNDEIPTGENEFVLPSVRLGASKSFLANDFEIQTAADIDLFFENRQSYYLNAGPVSFEPHIGAEITYKNRLSIRSGLTDFINDPEGGFTVSPTLGLGLRIASVYLDYGFASFTGSTSNLGYTHRISLRFVLNNSEN
jgi:hypothetical protein